MLELLLTFAIFAAGEDAVDFDTDLMPVLTKAGCNAGACHGSSAGRGGFGLSLFGADPEGDYASIVKELEGRRVNLAQPADSLLVAKPTGLLDHGGKTRLDPFGPGAALLERWIAEGAPRLNSRRLVRFDVEPALHVAESVGEAFTLRAVATFDDGSKRDVTEWTTFTAVDEGSLSVAPAGESGSASEPGRVVVLRPGQAVILARYLSEVVPVRVIAPLGDQAVAIPALANRTFIDDHVDRLLRILRLTPAPPADDATFLRRTRLALTGTLPEPEEVLAFLATDAPEKRTALIDRLLASEDFTDYWTYRFAKQLRVQSVAGDKLVNRSYRAWMRAQIARNRRYDEVVRALIMAEGDSHEHGEAAFYRMVTTPRGQAELVSEVFLGARLRCANCHDHPLDRWTQDDYHGLAAVFARLETGRVVKLRDFGEVTHPATGQAAVPRLPGERFLDAEEDCRGELATWLTSADNEAFAENMVNRIWAALIGRGLVEPVDDLRATNPATHPELLEALARDFSEHDFDLRHTIRLIARSAVFARGSWPAGAPPGGERYGAGALARPLEPEVLVDAITAVTGVADRYGAEPRGTRAIALADPGVSSRGLDLLGRCAGACDTAADAGETGLATKLHLLNGDLINVKLTARAGRLMTLLRDGASDEEIVREFYLRALSRPPTAMELAHWRAELEPHAAAEERRRVCEDFLWSLLNSREFKTNH